MVMISMYRCYTLKAMLLPRAKELQGIKKNTIRKTKLIKSFFLKACIRVIVQCVRHLPLYTVRFNPGISCHSLNPNKSNSLV